MKRPVHPVKPISFDRAGWDQYEIDRDLYYEELLLYVKYTNHKRYLSDTKKWQNRTLFAAPHGVMWVETINDERTVKYGAIKCNNGYKIGHDTFAWYKGGMKIWSDPHIACYGHQRGAFTEEIFNLLKKVYNDDVSDLEVVHFEPEPYHEQGMK